MPKAASKTKSGKQAAATKKAAAPAFRAELPDDLESLADLVVELLENVLAPELVAELLTLESNSDAEEFDADTAAEEDRLPA